MFFSSKKKHSPPYVWEQLDGFCWSFQNAKLWIPIGKLFRLLHIPPHPTPAHVCFFPSFPALVVVRVTESPPRGWAKEKGGVVLRRRGGGRKGGKGGSCWLVLPSIPSPPLFCGVKVSLPSFLCCDKMDKERCYLLLDVGLAALYCSTLYCWRCCLFYFFAAAGWAQ